MSVPTCPSCVCYKVTGPPLEGTYEFTMINCRSSGDPYALITVPILGNQVMYVCAVPNSINAFGMGVDELCSPNCECIGKEDCPVPPAYCYTVNLISGNNAFIQYITPLSGDQENLILFIGLSTFMSSKVICARENSITQISGDGTISIISSGIPCTENAVCTSTCDCVTITNVGLGFDLSYSYLECETGLRTPTVLLGAGDSITLCMLSDGFIGTGAPYNITTHGDCATAPECNTTTTTTTIAPLQPQRCIAPNPSAYQMERNWNDQQLPNPPDGIYSFEIIDLTLDGISYGIGSTITITAPVDLTVGPGIISGTFVQNINDWINSIPGVSTSGFTFYDDMSITDVPDVNSTYTIVIKRTTVRIGDIGYYIWFKDPIVGTGWNYSGIGTPVKACYEACWTCTNL